MDLRIQRGDNRSIERIPYKRYSKTKLMLTVFFDCSDIENRLSIYIQAGDMILRMKLQNTYDV